MWKREEEKYLVDVNNKRLDGISEEKSIFDSIVRCVNPEHDQLQQQNDSLVAKVDALETENIKLTAKVVSLEASNTLADKLNDKFVDEKQQLNKQIVYFQELSDLSDLPAYEQLRSQNKQLRDALKRCSPTRGFGNCYACGMRFDKEHTDDCTYIELTKEDGHD